MKVGEEVYEFIGQASGEYLAEALGNFLTWLREKAVVDLHYTSSPNKNGISLRAKLIGYRHLDSSIRSYKPAPEGTVPTLVKMVVADTAEVIRENVAIPKGTEVKIDPKGGSDILPKGSYIWEKQNWKPLDT